MVTLKKVTIHKYKSIETDQTFEVEADTTVLVGMNESGKTSLLEGLAKTNYFEREDKAFEFNATHDYPRKEKKKMDKAGGVAKAVTCTYELGSALVDKINRDVGKDAVTSGLITVTSGYDNRRTFGMQVDGEVLQKRLAVAAGDPQGGVTAAIKAIRTPAEFNAFVALEENAATREDIQPFEKYFVNKWEWSSQSTVAEYVARVWVSPHLPKFLYYDEYYTLPSRISIEELEANRLADESAKTAKALIELADLNLADLVAADDFEDFKAELEATQATITEELFEYWSSNKNLEIQFDIDKKTVGGKVVEHFLDIRVRNRRTGVSLPLRNRSKGFNWFFSFLVWFRKIQEDKDSQYIVLLDEPGLNLHASAQGDLLRFLAQLSTEYQVLYSTHSPFMIDSSELHRVRTVLETKSGSVVSDGLQEKDPNTLFPLQAALGYDIAQNLYVAKRNLLVEGTSDLIFLQAMSGVLEEAGRTGLRNDIVIVPVGGLEKVSTFISLMRGSKLDVACLLDTVIDQKNESKFERLIADKIIKKSKILFYDAFVESARQCDVEDLFHVDDYLSLFNGAFAEHADVLASDLDSSLERVVVALAAVVGKRRYNHYRPANYFARRGATAATLHEDTLSSFEKAISAVNGAF